MNWQEFYPFFVVLALLLVAIGAFWLGMRSGEKRERISASKHRLKQRQELVRYFREKQQYYWGKVQSLEKELEHVEQVSESYRQKSEDIAYYRQRVLVCEQQIKQLSADEPENKALALLFQLKGEPEHANPARSDWDALFALTDALFNRPLATLQERYALTRHEQEIVCLLLWRFSRKEQLAIFHNTSDALTKSKQRLKKRLMLDERSDVESFVRQL